MLKIQDQYIISVEISCGKIGYSRFEYDAYKYSPYPSEETEEAVNTLVRALQKNRALPSRNIKKFLAPRYPTFKNRKNGSLAGIPITCSIPFEINSQCSKIDRRFSVSENCWGVSLIVYRGMLGRHTSIIVESLEHGKYKMQAAELNGQGDIFFGKVEGKKKKTKRKKQSVLRRISKSAAKIFRSGTKCLSGSKKPEEEKIRFNFDPADIRWSMRTCVFKMPKEKVKPVLDEIEKEAQAAEGKNWQGAFSPFGDRSVLQKWSSSEERNSCFSWARSYLKKMGIELGESSMDYLVTIPDLYMYRKGAFKKTPFPNIDWEDQQQLARHEV